MPSGNILLGINITLLLKNKYFFEEDLYCSQFGNTFQLKLYHVKTSNFFALQIN